MLVERTDSSGHVKRHTLAVVAVGDGVQSGGVRVAVLPGENRPQKAKARDAGRVGLRGGQAGRRLQAKWGSALWCR